MNGKLLFNQKSFGVKYGLIVGLLTFITFIPIMKNGDFNQTVVLGTLYLVGTIIGLSLPLYGSISVFESRIVWSSWYIIRYRNIDLPISAITDLRFEFNDKTKKRELSFNIIKNGKITKYAIASFFSKESIQLYEAISKALNK